MLGSGSGYTVGLHLQKFEARNVKFAQGVCSMSTRGSTCQHKVNKEFHSMGMSMTQQRVLWIFNRLYTVDANWRHTLVGHEMR